MADRREELRAKLAEALDKAIAKRKARVTASPPPRYDEVYHEGADWLDAMARGEVHDSLVDEAVTLSQGADVPGER